MTQENQQTSKVFESTSKKAQEIYSILSKIKRDPKVFSEENIFIDKDPENDYLGIHYFAEQVGTFGMIMFEPSKITTPKNSFNRLGFNYTTTPERDEIAYKDLLHGNGIITHYGATAENLPTIGFTWKKDKESNLARLTKLSIRVPRDKPNEREYKYDEGLDWQIDTLPRHNSIPNNLTGQSKIKGITIPWEIDYDAKINEIISTSRLNEFHKRLVDLLK